MSSASTTGRTAGAGMYHDRGMADGGYDVVAGRDFTLTVETPMPWVRVLHTTGALDSATADRLTGCVRTQLDRGVQHVVLDLSAVELVTPAGLTALRQARQAAAAANAELHLAGLLRPEVTRPVRDRWRPAEFETHRTTIEALAAISEWPRDRGCAGRWRP